MAAITNTFPATEQLINDDTLWGDIIRSANGYQRVSTNFWFIITLFLKSGLPVFDFKLFYIILRVKRNVKRVGFRDCELRLQPFMKSQKICFKHWTSTVFHTKRSVFISFTSIQYNFFRKKHCSFFIRVYFSLLWESARSYIPGQIESHVITWPLSDLLSLNEMGFVWMDG